MAIRSSYRRSIWLDNYSKGRYINRKNNHHILIFSSYILRKLTRKKNMALTLVGTYDPIKKQITMTASGGVTPYFFSAWATPGGSIPSTVNFDPAITVLVVTSPRSTDVIFGSYDMTVTDSTSPTPLTATATVFIQPTELAIQLTDQFGNVYTKSDVINIPTTRPEHLVLTAHVGVPSPITPPPITVNNPNAYLDPKTYRIGWYKELFLYHEKNTVTIKRAGVYGIVVWHNGYRATMHIVINDPLPL